MEWKDGYFSFIITCHSVTVGNYMERYSSLESGKGKSEVLVYCHTSIEHRRYFAYSLYIFIQERQKGVIINHEAASFIGKELELGK